MLVLTGPLIYPPQNWAGFALLSHDSLFPNSNKKKLFSKKIKKLLFLKKSYYYCGYFLVQSARKKENGRQRKTIEGELWFSLGTWQAMDGRENSHTGNGLGSVHHQHHAFALIYQPTAWPPIMEQRSRSPAMHATQLTPLTSVPLLAAKPAAASAWPIHL